LEWPLRLPQEVAEDLAERGAEAPLDGRAADLPLPLEWFPPEWLMLEWLLLEWFPLEWLPLDGRAAVERESALGRRAGWLLEADCAGLRSREWAAGRLKWGLAAVDLALAAGLCTAAGRGA
jgi:hypothetical protein